MKKREFKYYPKDFKDLTVKVVHMDLFFDIHDKYTRVNSKLKLKTIEKINKLELNAKNLDLLGLKCEFLKDYEYNIKEDKIYINFIKKIQENTEIIIETETICRPTNNILEGLYYDVTPEGCLLTQITQCQQWGFQRLVPCIDDMTAKCTYKTTITADSRYTNIISNGDVIEQRKSIGNGRDKIVYENTRTPMAPYLFFLGVGTYKTFTREFEYPNGDKFMLEILGPVNSGQDKAEIALDILFNAIMWIYLFTGKEKYKDLDIKNKIFSLIKEREELKKQNKKEELKNIKNTIKKLCFGLKFGYKYTGTVYREIGMQNSNFGGMENVGNTTITTNKLMPFKDMTDGAFEYMINVKCHEFYHNINGSEVTGRSPFEIWLNEAVTVFIETEYLSELMSEEYQRLDRVLDLIMPGGTFEKDSGVNSMPIEPDGFNNPDELITGVTYVKAPEFIRMVQVLTGKENFAKGLDLYYTKYKHSNASRKQWVKCMEEISKIRLQKMANTWLKQTGFPVVNARTEYDEKLKKLKIFLEQKKIKGKTIWEFPFNAVLFNNNGEIITSLEKMINKQKTKIEFKNIKEKPAFVSLNRGYLFYGKLFYEQNDSELMMQAKFDNDIINKYITFYKLADKEKINLIKNPNYKVSEEFIDLFYSFINNEDLMKKAGSQILTITQSVENEKYNYLYQKLYEVKERIYLEIAEKYKTELLNLYNKYKNKIIQGFYVQKELSDIKYRQVKNLCLYILSRLDTKDIHNLIKEQYLNSTNATDRFAAFGLYLKSSAKDKIEIFEKERKYSENNLVSYESFLSIIARSEGGDALDLIKIAEKSPAFKIEQPNCNRTLYYGFISNKRKSFLTGEGRDFVKGVLIKLAQVNEHSTFLILGLFGKIDYLREKYKAEIIKLLLEVLKTLDKEKVPTVYNNIKRIILNSKMSLKSYEKFYKTKVRF